MPANKEEHCVLMSSLEMEQGPGERKPETASLFAVIAPNYHWPVDRRQCLDNVTLKGMEG